VDVTTNHSTFIKRNDPDLAPRMQICALERFTY